MSEHQKHTEFLKDCLLYDDGGERHQMAEKLTALQRDLRSVRRAMWLMVFLTGLAVARLGYGVVLVDNFPYNTPPFILNLICAVGLGALISLLAFAGLGMVYYQKLDQRREECRQRFARLLSARLGKSDRSRIESTTPS
jgi:hypothetical protein